jgi:hypothetical protein
MFRRGQLDLLTNKPLHPYMAPRLPVIALPQPDEIIIIGVATQSQLDERIVH